MKQLILTVGASCSGKTTWTEQFIEDHYGKQYTGEDWVNLNRDDIRFNEFCNGVRDWTKYKFTKANENKVTEIIDGIAQEAVKDDFNIIVSDTNTTLSLRVTLT